MHLLHFLTPFAIIFVFTFMAKIRFIITAGLKPYICIVLFLRQFSMRTKISKKLSTGPPKKWESGK